MDRGDQRPSGATGIADDKLVLQRVPGEKPADEISAGEVDHAGRRLFVILGVAACVFLVFAGIIVFLGLLGNALRR